MNNTNRSPFTAILLVLIIASGPLLQPRLRSGKHGCRPFPWLSATELDQVSEHCRTEIVLDAPPIESVADREDCALQPKLAAPANDAEIDGRVHQAGDRALAALVRRWQTPLLRLAFRITGNQAEAEEVRQEVFLKILRSSRRLRHPERFDAWAVMNRSPSTVSTIISALSSTDRSIRDNSYWVHCQSLCSATRLLLNRFLFFK